MIAAIYWLLVVACLLIAALRVPVAFVAWQLRRRQLEAAGEEAVNADCQEAQP